MLSGKKIPWNNQMLIKIRYKNSMLCICLAYQLYHPSIHSFISIIIIIIFVCILCKKKEKTEKKSKWIRWKNNSLFYLLYLLCIICAKMFLIFFVMVMHVHMGLNFPKNLSILFFYYLHICLNV